VTEAESEDVPESKIVTLVPKDVQHAERVPAFIGRIQEAARELEAVSAVAVLIGKDGRITIGWALSESDHALTMGAALQSEASELWQSCTTTSEV
jgi:hypothetical protein